MYNDRIEIINPGALYGTNKLKKLGTATTMESRNPTIVRILEEKGDVIENRHSGIPTMIREMKKYGLPKPEFYEERDSFKVIFKNKNVIINKQSDTQSDTQSDAQSDTQSDAQSDTQKTHLEIEKKVLDFCIEPKSAQEIRTYLNISSKRYVAYKIIRPLINSGKLDYTNKNSINARNQKYLTVKKN